MAAPSTTTQRDRAQCHQQPDREHGKRRWQRDFFVSNNQTGSITITDSSPATTPRTFRPPTLPVLRHPQGPPRSSTRRSCATGCPRKRIKSSVLLRSLDADPEARALGRDGQNLVALLVKLAARFRSGRRRRAAHSSVSPTATFPARSWLHEIHRAGHAAQVGDRGCGRLCQGWRRFWRSGQPQLEIGVREANRSSTRWWKTRLFQQVVQVLRSPECQSRAAASSCFGI